MAPEPVTTHHTVLPAKKKQRNHVVRALSHLHENRRRTELALRMIRMHGIQQSKSLRARAHGLLQRTQARHSVTSTFDVRCDVG